MCGQCALYCAISVLLILCSVLFWQCALWCAGSVLCSCVLHDTCSMWMGTGFCLMLCCAVCRDCYHDNDIPADCDVGRSRVDEESPVVVKQTHQPIPKQLFDVPLDGDSSGNTTFARPAVLRLECQPSRSPLSLISRDANTGMSSRPATKRKKVHQVDIPCDRMLTGKENIVQ